METAVQSILEILKEQDITKSQLAEKSGLALGTISRILNGKQALKTETLTKIANALEVSIYEIRDTEADSNARFKVAGYLDYCGDIYRIKSLKDLKTQVKKIETLEEGFKFKEKKLPPQKPVQLTDIDFNRWEDIDASKVEVRSFKSGKDIVEGEPFDIGNMCSGYPFLLNGVRFNNSEAAYIAGKFSNNTDVHIKIQKQLTENNDGYAAKKKIRQKNEVVARSKEDWETFNVEYMKYVVWQKCKTNKDFAKKLKSVPITALIVENSTGMTSETAQVWGCFNQSLMDLRYAKEKKYQMERPTAKEEELNIERNKWNRYGIWEGRNLMGKILKACSICLINDEELPIDYDLLRSKHIYLLGKEMEFPQQRNAKLRKGIIGAIIGDIVGSRYEFAKKIPAKIQRLFGSSSTFTDDTILTIAIADALISKKPFADTLWDYGQLYPNAGWGYSFKKWLKGSKGTQNNSQGNGCAMRISPVGFYAKTIEEALELAKECTIPTHNSPEGIAGAQAIAASVFLAKNGHSKDDIKSYVENKFGYDLSLSVAEIHAFVKGVKQEEREFVKNTAPVAIMSFLEADNYENTIRLAISFGIDTDTTACMAGGIAAAYWGVPQELIEEAIGYLPDELLDVINKFDKTTFKNHRITPPQILRWRKDYIVAYGTNTDDTAGEDGYGDTHPSNFNHHPLIGYPIRTIGVSLEDVKTDIAGFITYAKANPDKTFLVSKVGLGKSGLGINVVAPLFEDAQELTNVYLPRAIVEAL